LQLLLQVATPLRLLGRERAAALGRKDRSRGDEREKGGDENTADWCRHGVSGSLARGAEVRPAAQSFPDSPSGVKRGNGPARAIALTESFPSDPIRQQFCAAARKRFGVSPAEHGPRVA
jgi:hypothetical protein